MRSAERAPRIAALPMAALLAALLAGCAAGGLRERVGMAPAAVTNPADAKADAAKANGANGANGANAAKAESPGAAVAPAAQRAYDDARRLLVAGRTDDAERAFRALVKAYPDLGGPHANLGLLLRQAGRLPEAVAEFEQAATLSPQQPVVFNQLGVAYRHNGQFDKAREAYEQAIALDARYAAPVLNLGILQDLYLRDAARALELYGRYQTMTGGQDATVAKWIADLKNRKPAKAAATSSSPSPSPSSAPPATARKEPS